MTLPLAAVILAVLLSAAMFAAVRLSSRHRHDLSELREEYALREEFLAAAAHDLRTPLTAISGFAQVILRKRQTDESDSDVISTAAERIDANVRRMSRILDEMLDLARGSAASKPIFVRADLVQIVADCVQEQRGLTGHAGITFTTGVERLYGRWDPERLGRAISNVIGNAVRYSPLDSQIEVSVGIIGPDTLLGRITIQDHGAGIPAADLPHVFDRYYRGQNISSNLPGTGLGLTAARRSVELHGGTIRVESTEGAGSTFTILLPVLETRSPDQAQVESRESAHAASRN